MNCAKVKLFALIFALSCSGGEAAEPSGEAAKFATTRLRVTQSAVNTRSAVLWIAASRRLFSKHGLEVETVYLRSSNLQMAALATGQVQIGNSGGAPVLSAVSGGQELKIIASPNNRLAYDVVAKPEIKEAADLKGKRFGVTNIGGTTWMAAILALEHLGLDPKRDQIRINALGNQTILAQAIEAGNIDVTLLDPFISRRLRQKGFRVLIELYSANIPFVNTSVVVSSAYLQKHSDVVERFLMAMLESQAFMAAPANKGTVIRTVMDQMKLADPSVAEEGYQELLLGMEQKPYPSLEPLRNIQRVMGLMNPKVNKVKLEDIIEPRIVRKLDESGFIDSLYDSTKKK